MTFYGTGSKRKKSKDGDVSFVNVIIPLTATNRVQAVNQAERIAKRDRIKLDGVYLMRSSQDRGGILTKNMQKQRASRRG